MESKWRFDSVLIGKATGDNYVAIKQYHIVATVLVLFMASYKKTSSVPNTLAAAGKYFFLVFFGTKSTTTDLPARGKVHTVQYSKLTVMSTVLYWTCYYRIQTAC